MQLTCFDTVVEAVAQRLGVNPADLAKTDAEPMKRFFAESVREVWSRTWWIDIMVVARRYFSDWYSANKSYSAGDLVYEPNGRKYYRALRATTGNSPTLLSYWAEAKESYNATPFDPTVQYVVGDRVHYVDHDFAVFTQPPVGALPTNATYFSVLRPFVRALPWECQSYQSACKLQDPSAPVACAGTHLWNTIAEMRADTTYLNDCYGILLGYASKGDLIPIRQYSFFADSIRTDNDREIIKPSNIVGDAPGRWIQML
jgi:hypothetical protein